MGRWTSVNQEVPGRTLGFLFVLFPYSPLGINLSIGRRDLRRLRESKENSLSVLSHGSHQIIFLEVTIVH